MPQIAKLGDTGIGICPAPEHIIPLPFTATIISGAATVLTNGIPSANAFSVSTCTCGHTAIAMSFSSNVLLNGGGAHRMGDTGINSAGGIYTIISASANVIAGG